jgi:hypothetical protein
MRFYNTIHSHDKYAVLVVNKEASNSTIGKLQGGVALLYKPNCRGDNRVRWTMKTVDRRSELKPRDKERKLAYYMLLCG